MTQKKRDPELEAAAARIEKILERESAEDQKRVAHFPAWVSQPVKDRYAKAWRELTKPPYGFTDDQIKKYIKQHGNDKLLVPGVVPDSVAFIHLVDWLYAVEENVKLAKRGEIVRGRERISFTAEDAINNLEGLNAVCGHKHKERQKNAAAKAARLKKLKGQANQNKINAEIQKLEKTHSDREIPGILKKRPGFPSERTIRRAIKKYRTTNPRV